MALNLESEAELAHRNNVSGPVNLSLFRAFASRKAEFGRRTIWFRFHLSPAALVGDDHVEKIILTRNLLEGAPFAQVARLTKEQIELPCARLPKYRLSPLQLLANAAIAASRVGS